MHCLNGIALEMSESERIEIQNPIIDELEAENRWDLSLLRFD